MFVFLNIDELVSTKVSNQLPDYCGFRLTLSVWQNKVSMLSILPKRTIWRINRWAIRYSNQPAARSNTMIRYGITSGVLLIKKFVATKINGFSWYISPVYGFIFALYMNAPSLTVTIVKWKSQMKNVSVRQTHHFFSHLVSMSLVGLKLRCDFE